MKKCIHIMILLFVTTAAEEQFIEQSQASSHPRRLIFIDNHDEKQQANPIKFVEFNNIESNQFEDKPRPIKFEDNPENDVTKTNEALTQTYLNQVSNNENNNIIKDHNLVVFDKKPRQNKNGRRRRRKPRQQRYPHEGGNGPSGYGLGVYGPGYGYVGYNPYYQQYSTPPRPQSAAEQALASVTEALTSIALNDDQQCVPKLLCEVAAGRIGGRGGSSIVDTFASMQPLITMIAAYNGLSNSPIFVFGRATFLGMTSKSNAQVCTDTYRLCPSDPDKLVNYLNNYKGGFFRFFKNPQYNQPGNDGPQNVQQFLGQLSNLPQNFVNFQSQLNNGYEQNLANYQSYSNYGYNTGLYGIQNNPFQAVNNNYNYASGYNVNGYQTLPVNSQGYGNPTHGYKETNRNRLQRCGLYDPYKFSALCKSRSTYSDENDKKPQRRILTKIVHDDFEADSEDDDERKLVFPESSKLNVFRKGKFAFITTPNNNRFVFPETQKNVRYTFSDNFVNKYTANKYNTYEVYEDPDKDVEKEEGVEVVYVVRGDGDPNHPEVVKIKNGVRIY